MKIAMLMVLAMLGIYSAARPAAEWLGETAIRMEYEAQPARWSLEAMPLELVP